MWRADGWVLCFLGYWSNIIIPSKVSYKQLVTQNKIHTSGPNPLPRDNPASFIIMTRGIAGSQVVWRVLWTIIFLLFIALLCLNRVINNPAHAFLCNIYNHRGNWMNKRLESSQSIYGLSLCSVNIQPSSALSVQIIGNCRKSEHCFFF